MRHPTFFAVLLGGTACITVPPADETEASSGGETTSTTTTGPTSTDPATTDPATTDPGTTAETTATTSGGMSTATGTGDGTTTGMTDVVLFADDFDRPDGGLGNGWVEKTPGAYRVFDGVVVGTDSGPPYFDSIWYRPPEEAVADIDMTVLFRFTTLPSSTTPQLHARIQPGSSELGTETAYLAYAPSSSELRVGSVLDGSLSTALEAPISPPLEVDVWYRLRLTVSGSLPVQLYGAVEASDGNGGWEPLADVSGSDPSAQAVTEAGTFGVSGNNQLSEVDYDDFEARAP